MIFYRIPGIAKAKKKRSFRHKSILALVGKRGSAHYRFRKLVQDLAILGAQYCSPNDGQCILGE